MKKFSILSLLCLCLAFCGIMFIAGCNEAVEKSDKIDIAHTKGTLVSIVVDSNSTNCLGGFVCSDCGKTFVDTIEYSEYRLDSIVLFNPYQNDCQIFFTDIKDLDPNSKKLKKAEEIQMIDFKPNVLAASIYIPTEKINPKSKS